MNKIVCKNGIQQEFSTPAFLGFCKPVFRFDFVGKGSPESRGREDCWVYAHTGDSLHQVNLFINYRNNQ